MIRRHTRLIIIVASLSTTFCSGGSSPNSPSSIFGVDPGGPSRPVDPRFNDTFWRQLVFDQFDRPNTIDNPTTLTRVNTKSLNVYIRMGDPTGRRVVSYDQRDHMQRAIPRLVEQLTGQPYSGSIEEGIGDRTRSGWITVRFVTYEEEPEIAEGACGRATIGTNPGNIWIIRRARGNKNCVHDAVFPEVFAHELGHALGFFHVADRTAIMTTDGLTGRASFTEREQYHAQLAYEVGRGQAYRGWPLVWAGDGSERPLPAIFVVD